MSKSCNKERKALQKLLNQIDPSSDYFIVQKGYGTKDFHIFGREIDNYVGETLTRQIKHDAEILWAFLYCHLPWRTFDELRKLLADPETRQKVCDAIQKELETERKRQQV